MKYTVDLQSPDMDVLFEKVDKLLLNAAMTHHSRMAQMFGRGHAVTVKAGRDVDAIRRAVGALRKSMDEATPERADGEPFEGSLQAGDEMALVYGRPRNDPRNVRQGPRR